VIAVSDGSREGHHRLPPYGCRTAISARQPMPKAAERVMDAVRDRKTVMAGTSVILGEASREGARQQLHPPTL